METNEPVRYGRPPIPDETVAKADHLLKTTGARDKTIAQACGISPTWVRVRRQILKARGDLG